MTLTGIVLLRDPTNILEEGLIFGLKESVISYLRFFVDSILSHYLVQLILILIVVVSAFVSLDLYQNQEGVLVILLVNLVLLYSRGSVYAVPAIDPLLESRLANHVQMDQVLV